MPIILNGTTGEIFPTWTTGTRPSTPSQGQTGYNTTLNTLEVYSGTAWTPFVTTARAGTVLQVVQGTYATSVTTTSTSYVTTGLTASITPSSTSNKILVTTSQTFYTNASARGLGLQITRGASAIYTGASYTLLAGGGAVIAQQSLNYLDSPSSTSSTTYTVNFATPDAATVTANYGNSTSVMILMEIAG